MNVAAHGTATFRHGVHPEESKAATCGLAIERMPFVETYVLPLSQHTGKPSRPIVEVGARVTRGQTLATADGFISTALHAPVTGEVVAIEPRPHPFGSKQLAIVLRTDPYDSQRLPEPEPMPVDATPQDVVARVQRAGIVGLGGAAFPSHVKLLVPDGKRARFVILNGCECEPYLTCDHRLMLERADAVLRGLEIVRRLAGAERGYVGVEANKADAIERLRTLSSGDPDTEIVSLEVKYPQGAEKMLIEAIFRKELPAGKLPIDLEVVVNNVGTAVALADLFETGRPLIERVVTVTGPGIERPANLMVPLGTPLRDLVEHCGGLRPGVRQVILGGPMMGMAQKSLDVPVVKGASGVLALDRPAPVVSEDPCIRCGRCLEACPMYLNPSRLHILVRNDEPELLGHHHMMDCCECASCSFVCPSHIPLVQLMRVGKAMVRKNKA